jgi:hypothetical protein
MAAGAGKELAEKAAVGANHIIIDSNTAIALAKDSDPLLRGTMNGGEQARVAYVKSLPAGTELRVGNVTVGEAPNIGLKGVPLNVARESTEYRSVLQTLETAKAGTGTGFADRAVLADAFFAITDPGTVARFLQADQNTVKAMARLAGIDVNAVGGFPGLVRKYGTNGFKVTVGSRSIIVIPVP